MAPVPDPDIDSPTGNSAILLIYGGAVPHAGNVDAVSGLSGRCGVAVVAARRLASALLGSLPRTRSRRGRSSQDARRVAEPAQGGLRFAFYGRVSTEDYQDPVTSRARQLG